MKPPLLEAKALLRKAKVGRPTRVAVKLYDDHLEAQDKTGTIVLNTPLSNVGNASYNPGAFSFKNWVVEFMVSDQYYALDFMPLKQRIFGGAGGLTGIVFGSKVGSGRKIAQTWATTMQQHGVQFKKSFSK